jgi:hypothetical protein
MGKLSEGKSREIPDKDGLTPEQRRKIEEIKENLTYRVDKGEFE